MQFLSSYNKRILLNVNDKILHLCLLAPECFVERFLQCLLFRLQRPYGYIWNFIAHSIMYCSIPPFYDEKAFGIYQKILSGKVEWPKSMDRLAK